MSLADLENDLQNVEQQEERDTLGGGGVREGGIYDLAVEVAYSQRATSGALGFIVVFQDRDGNKITYRNYITSGNAKGCKPYYERDGKKFPLPGFSQTDNMVKFFLDKPLTKLNEKLATIKIYNSDQQKEVPTEVTVYPELRGLTAKVGLTKVRQNKSVKQGNAYVDTNEEQFINEFDKFFDFDTGCTKTELTAKAEAAFIEKWKEKYENQVVDKFKEVKNAPKSASAGATKPLFGADTEEQKAPAASKSLFPS